MGIEGDFDDSALLGRSGFGHDSVSYIMREGLHLSCGVGINVGALMFNM